MFLLSISTHMVHRSRPLFPCAWRWFCRNLQWCSADVQWWWWCCLWTWSLVLFESVHLFSCRHWMWPRQALRTCCFSSTEHEPNTTVVSDPLRKLEMCSRHQCRVSSPTKNIKQKSYRSHWLSQVRLLQSLPDLFICSQIERIDVLSDRSSEDERCLRNDWHVLSQRVQSHLVSFVLTKQVFRPWLWLTDSEYWLDDWWLASTCSSDNTDFLAWQDLEWNILQYQRQSFSVPHWDVLELETGFFWPTQLHTLTDMLPSEGFFFLLELSLKSNGWVVWSSELLLWLFIDKEFGSLNTDHDTFYDNNLS